VTYSVTLTKQLNPPDEYGFVKLVMVVTDVVGFADFGVFTYDVNATTGKQVYNHVATPTDLQDYGYNVGEYFVRKSTLVSTYELATLADAALTEIEDRIQQLCSDMVLLDTAGVAQTVTISAP